MSQESIIDDLVQLPTIMVDIENEFANVASEMTRLDQRNLLSIKFAPKWKAIHNNFTMLMLSSKAEANDVSNKISELTNVMVPLLQLPIEQMSVEAKKGSFYKYIEDLEAFNSDAEKNCKHFLRLRQDVEPFNGSFHSTIKNDKEWITTRFEDINKKITELEKAIWKIQWKERWNTAVTTIIGNAEQAPSITTDKVGPEHQEMAGINILVDITPAAHKEMMETVLSYLRSGKVADDLQKKPRDMDATSIKSLLLFLQSMHKQSGQIQDEFVAVPQDISKLEHALAGMPKKIGTIQRMWNMLLSDSRTLLKQLSSVSDTERENELEQHIKTANITYELLQSSLGRYTLTVAKPT